MAFTGTAVVTQISDSLVRITGVSLASAADGTIGLADATGTPPDISLPVAFNPKVYAYTPGDPLALSDIIEISTECASVINELVPVAVVKTGTTHANWRATLTNTHGSASSSLEIYLRIH